LNGSGQFKELVLEGKSSFECRSELSSQLKSLIFERAQSRLLLAHQTNQLRQFVVSDGRRQLADQQPSFNQRRFGHPQFCIPSTAKNTNGDITTGHAVANHFSPESCQFGGFSQCKKVSFTHLSSTSRRHGQNLRDHSTSPNAVSRGRATPVDDVSAAGHDACTWVAHCLAIRNAGGVILDAIDRR
jgi:hypothetical protein